MTRGAKGIILGLSAIMLAQLQPNPTAFFTAYAEEETGEDAAEVLTGKCGENLTYEWSTIKVTYAGTTYGATKLTISGEGEMYDYEKGTSPFYNHPIVCLEIEEGVTSIGNYAFECSFSGYMDETITLPDSLERIGDFAFSNANQETGGRNIIIPKNVSDIGTGVFYASMEGHWENFYVDPENPYYCDVDGVLYTKDMTTLIACPQLKDYSAFVFPEGLLYINDFACAQVSEFGNLKLPEGLLGIGDYAFYWTNVGYELILPETLQTIGTMAFWNDVAPLSYAFIPCEAILEGYPFLYRTRILGYPGSDAERYVLDYSNQHTDTDQFVSVYSDDVFVLDDNRYYSTSFPNADGAPEVIYENISARDDIVTAMNKQNIENYLVYDITMQFEGEEVWPQAPVTVLVSLEGMKGTENLHVYRLEEDGSLTDMNAYVSNGFAVFETDHFSVYVLAEPGTEEQPADEEEETSGEKETESTADGEVPETASQEETEPVSEAAGTLNDNQSANTGMHNALVWYAVIALSGLAGAGMYIHIAGKRK